MDKKILFARFLHIKDDHITLKDIDAKDLDGLLEIYSNAHLFEFTPGIASDSIKKTKKKLRQFKKEHIKKTSISLGIYFDDKLVGVFKMFDIDYKASSVTIGYRISEDYWGRGIATRSVKLVVDYLFNVIKVNRIQAFVIPQNKASISVLTKNKFTFEGFLRESQHWNGQGIVSVNLYSILKSEYDVA